MTKTLLFITAFCMCILGFVQAQSYDGREKAWLKEYAPRPNKINPGNKLPLSPPPFSVPNPGFPNDVKTVVGYPLPGTYSHTTPTGDVRLLDDGMPCLVPKTLLVNTMPGAIIRKGYKLPEMGAIPNPLYPPVVVPKEEGK